MELPKNRSQKKIKMKVKQHKSNEKDIIETEKELEEKLTELFVH